MPTTNYMNPTSAAPAIGWQPNAAEGGLQWALRNADYRTNMDLSQAMSQIGLQGQQQDLAKTIATQPGAVAAMNAENQAKVQTAVPQAQANLASTQQATRSTTLANDLNSATMQSKIAKTLSDNALSMKENGKKEMDLVDGLTNRLATYKQAGVQLTPQLVAREAGLIGMSPNNELVQAVVTGQMTPDSLHTALNNANQSYRQKMEELKVTTTSQENIAKWGDATKIRVAEIMAGAKPELLMTQDIAKALDEAASQGVKTFKLPGGDEIPLVDKDGKRLSEQLLKGQAALIQMGLRGQAYQTPKTNPAVQESVAKAQKKGGITGALEAVGGQPAAPKSPEDIRKAADAIIGTN